LGRLVGGYQRFGGTYMKMEAIGSSETLVTTYKTTRRHNLEITIQCSIVLVDLKIATKFHFYEPKSSLPLESSGHYCLTWKSFSSYGGICVTALLLLAVSRRSASLLRHKQMEIVPLPENHKSVSAFEISFIVPVSP
jgi:hypothetical protein